MKTFKIFVLCLMVTLGLYSCGSDKKDDPQPTDPRDNYVGVYSGTTQTWWISDDLTTEFDDDIEETYEVKKNEDGLVFYKRNKVFFSVSTSKTYGDGTYAFNINNNSDGIKGTHSFGFEGSDGMLQFVNGVPTLQFIYKKEEKTYSFEGSVK